MTKKEENEVEFENGWADELGLSQEDYDALVRGIQELVATGEIFEDATPINELPEEEQQAILEQITRKNTRH
jgi:choline kinase